MAGQAKTDLAETAQQRSQVYGFLSALYAKELTQELLSQVRAPEFRGLLSGLGVDFGPEFYEEKDEEALIEELAVEYTMLFLGPGEHISPHESVHHERDDGDWGTHWAQATVDVKKFVETVGFKVKESSHFMPDHISVELEMMQKVAEREARAWREDDKDTAKYCLQIQKMFVEDHLAEWIPDFTKKIVEGATMPFYKEVAKLTDGFIEFEKSNVGEYLTEAQK